MGLAVLLVAASAPAAFIPGQFIIAPPLSGSTQQYDGWEAIHYQDDEVDIWQSALSTSANPSFSGNPAFPGTGNWPGSITSKQGSTGHDAALSKLSNNGTNSAGPYLTSSSLYFSGGYSGAAAVFAGTLGISDATPVANLANVVFQIEFGEFAGWDFYNHQLPVLNYNGGSQALQPNFNLVTNKIQNGTFEDPTTPGNMLPVYINTYLMQWDLSGVAGPINNYSIVFSGAQHAQLYAMRLDASDAYALVPEPASAALLAGIPALLLLKRRRRA